MPKISRSARRRLCPMPCLVKSLKVSGFRGFNDQRDLDLSRELVFLFGDNGSGKSSTLSAIEWCLFGDVEFIRYEGRTHDELINTFQNEGTVELILKSPDGDVALRRTKPKRREKTHLTLTLPDGAELEDEQAEQAVYRIFRLTLDDFIRSTYLHQESVRGLLTEDPRDRNAALDRLLGLDSLRNITDAIRLVKISDRQTKLQTRIDQLEADIKASLGEAKRRLDESRRKGKHTGLADTQFEIEHGAKLVEDSTSELRHVAEEAGLDPPSIEVPTSVRALGEAAESLQGYVKRIRRKLPEQTKIDELTQLRTECSAVLSDYSARASDVLSKKKSLRDFEKKHGDADAISRRIVASARKLEQLEEERSGIKSRFKVIKDALQYLRETEETACPVCGRSIEREKLLDHLKSELEAHETKDLESIDTRILKSQQAKAEAEREQREHKKLSDELARVERDLEAVLKEVAAVLQRVITAKDDAEALLKARLADLGAQIKKFEKPLHQREGQLQRIEDRCEKLMRIAEVLKEQESIKRLEKLLEGKELQALRQNILELESLREILDAISKAVTTVQTDLAASMISNAQDDISAYYRRLCNHPYYEELEIEVKPRTVRGVLRNEYYIKGVNKKESEETLASQKFSTGQMNCVALAIYLALAKKDIYSHNLGFLVLDDPSQNLDTSHKKALAEILLELVPQKQVILATHDKELQSILENEGGQKKLLIYRFDRCPKEGPEIRCQV
ncbi:AAA family ATPase [Acidobacteriia bacterium AH_259_A11_L15]|nr:AAA family ATPase [Acidobacteriia bacterium AH_259_A11_L15]